MVEGDGIDFFNPAECERFIREQFAGNPQRLAHIMVVADRVRQSARDMNELNPGQNVDEELAFVAALVHDIGYLEDAYQTGFHPLDGARYLERSGFPKLAELIVGHSSAPEESQLRGLGTINASDDIIADLITYWDSQVKQGGEVVAAEQRHEDILLRYGEHSVVGQAAIRARPRIQEIARRVERLLQLRAG